MEKVLAQEDHALGAPGHGPELFAHAPFAHHLAGQLGVADEVVAGTGGEVAVDEELGGTAAHAHGEGVLDDVARVDVTLLEGQLLGHAQRQSRRQDGDLVDGVGVLEHVGEHGVAALVEGDALFLGLRQHQALASLSHEHAVAGGFEVLLVDLVRTAPNGVEGGLVHQVGQIGAAHARGAPCHELEVDAVADALVLAVDLQDGQALFEVGEGDDDLAVETAGPEQRGVEDVGAVGGGDDDDPFGRVEAVHLVEHLVEGLFPLVVAAAQTGPPLAADGVDLVDEDDGRRLLPGRLEEVPDPAGPDPDEHLHEVGSAHREEGDAGLSGNGPGEEGFPCSRRTDEKDPLGDLGPDVPEAVGGLQEVDDLGDLDLDALVAGHVGEGGPRPLGRVEAGPGAADRHDPAHLALGPATDPEEDPDEEDEDDDGGEPLAEKADRRGVVVEVLGRDGVPHQGDVGVRWGGAPVGGVPLTAVDAGLEIAGDDAGGVVDGYRLDLVAGDVG